MDTNEGLFVAGRLAAHDLASLTTWEQQALAMRINEALIPGFKVRVFQPDGTFRDEYDYSKYSWETFKFAISSTW